MHYIIFDLEATCGLPDEVQSEIIEIGAVKVNEKLEIVDEFQTFIRPVISPELTPFCKELTSITQEDVGSAPAFNDAIRSFRTWIGQDYWLCSWGFYDKKMLKQNSEQWGLDTDWVKKHISIKHQHGKMIGVTRGIGMDAALKKLEIPLEGTHHRGIDDARNIAKIFQKIYPDLKF
jgi:inhibitor of KinA sporulation pathway (predicted exonuclease)